jgi:hypothetical protein
VENWDRAESSADPFRFTGNPAPAGRSDLVIVFGSSRRWLTVLALCFSLNLFELLANLIEPVLKFFGFDLYTDFAPRTDDMRLGLCLNLPDQE